MTDSIFHAAYFQSGNTAAKPPYHFSCFQANLNYYTLVKKEVGSSANCPGLISWSLQGIGIKF